MLIASVNTSIISTSVQHLYKNRAVAYLLSLAGTMFREVFYYYCVWLGEQSGSCLSISYVSIYFVTVDCPALLCNYVKCFSGLFIDTSPKHQRNYT